MVLCQEFKECVEVEPNAYIGMFRLQITKSISNNLKSQQVIILFSKWNNFYTVKGIFIFNMVIVGPHKITYLLWYQTYTKLVLEKNKKIQWTIFCWKIKINSKLFSFKINWYHSIEFFVSNLVMEDEREGICTCRILNFNTMPQWTSNKENLEKSKLCNESE